MEKFESLFPKIERDFVESKINAQVFEDHSYKEILILIGKDFLDMFDTRDRVMVTDEFLSPQWGKYLYGNFESLPYWMAQVKYKTVEKSRLFECLDQLEKAMDYHKKRIRN